MDREFADKNTSVDRVMVGCSCLVMALVAILEFGFFALCALALWKYITG